MADTTAPAPVPAPASDAPLTWAQMWGVTLFDQLACRIALKRLRYDGRYTPPSLQGSLIYPGNFGVFNWGSIAVDPRRQIAFTTPAYLAFVSRLVPRHDDTSLYVQGGNRPEGGLPALTGRQAARWAPFRWVNTVLGNIKTALVGTYRHVSAKHAQRYLSSFAYRFNRRHRLDSIVQRLAWAAVHTAPQPYRVVIADA